MRHVACLLLCVSLLLAAGTDASPARRSAYLESSDSLSTAPVTTYAREAGIGLGEARLALAREELAVPHISALRVEFADRLAGLFWARSPAQHIVVRLTGDGYVANREIKTEAGAVPVRFVTGVAATTVQLTARLQAAVPVLQKLIPEISGAWVDETTGRIVLAVAAPQTSKHVYDTERATIEAVVGFPVEFTFSPRPSDLIGPPVSARPAR